MLWQARRLGRILLPGAPRLADGVPLLVALWPEFALSMTNGLETGMAALLLTAGLADFLACHREARAAWNRTALLFLGAGLARPELTPLFPLLLLGSALCGLRSRQAWTALGGYLAAVVLLLWLRWTYYGAFVPNTYWAKHLPAAQALPLGAAYLRHYALPGGPALGSALYGLGLWSVVRHGGRARLALPTALGVHLLFLLRSGGDWMMDGRFFVVVLPVCAAVWLGSVQTLCDLAARTGQRYALLVVVALAGFASLQLSRDAGARAAAAGTRPGVTDLPTALSPHAPLEEWKPGNHAGRLAIARWVASHAGAGQCVLTSEMGLVTVVNPDVRFLDIRGLTDRRIARFSGCRRDLSGVQAEREWMDTAKPLGAYVRERRPEWVALVWDVSRRDAVGTAAENDLYVPAGTFPIRCDGRALTVATWRRRDVPPLSACFRHN